ADKVSIGSDAVIAAEEYIASGVKTGQTGIEQIAHKYGAQAVVISVDPKRVYCNDPSGMRMELRVLWECYVSLITLVLVVSCCVYAAVDRYTEFLFAQNSATTCIRPILAGLRSVKSVVPADSLLPLHRMFMKAVLISGFGHLAQEFIDTPLTNVSRTHVTSKDVLLYYYYASLVCIVQKAYEKAYGCLSMVCM
ncbi:hypothetical protein SARC_11576, partial [Sphaeroforma arctica JP610]